MSSAVLDWKADCTMELDDSVPRGELHCIHDATRGVFTVKLSDETWTTTVRPRPYPFVAVVTTAAALADDVHDSIRPGIRRAAADCPDASHADGGSYNVMIAVSFTDRVSFREQALLAAENQPFPGRLLLVLPEGWGELGGGTQWKRQAILMASYALRSALDAAGVGAGHVYRNRLVQIDDDVEQIAAADGAGLVAEVPNFALMALLAAPFSAEGSTTVVSTGIRDGALCRWSCDKVARPVSATYWRDAAAAVRSEKVLMLDLERLAAAASGDGVSYVQPSMLSRDPADAAHSSNPGLCGQLSDAECALVQGLYVADRGTQPSQPSAPVKTLYSASNAEAIRRSAAPETPPAFDAEHYPKGVNHFFYTMTACELEAKFGGKDGLFHTESRDIATSKLQLADHVVNAMLPPARPDAADAVAVVEPRYTVLELGCGTGLITEVLIEALAARAANVDGSGVARAGWHLMSTEVSPGFVHLATERLNNSVAPALLANGAVDVMHHPPHCIPAVPTASCDVCAIVDVYHHLEFPRTMMRDVWRALKPGGRLLLVDFHRDRDLHKGHPDDPEWVMKHVRGDQKTFTAEILACGFENPTTVDIAGIKENYCVVFHRSAVAASALLQ